MIYDFVAVCHFPNSFPRGSRVYLLDSAALSADASLGPYFNVQR